MQCGRVQRDEAVLLELGLADQQNPGIQIDVRVVEPDHLPTAQAGARSQADHGVEGDTLLPTGLNRRILTIGGGFGSMWS